MNSICAASPIGSSRRSRSGTTWGIVLGVGLGLGVALFGRTSDAGTTTHIQTFDSAASAAAEGWTGHQNTTAPQNYGWSNSNNAAGAAIGEAGGDFTDGDTVVSYYADTAINGPIVGEKLSASGKLGLISGASDRAQTLIGHFDATVLAGNARMVGLRLSDGSAGVIRAQPVVFYSSGGSDTGPLLNLPTGRTYTFSYVYDPVPDTLVVNLVDNLSNVYSSTAIVDPILGTAAFNAFGLRTDALSFDNALHPPITYFMDDVAYTVIPEPASAGVVIGVGVVAFAARGRRRFSRRIA